MLEIDKQLSEEEMQRAKLEIEKSKIKSFDEEDKKIEIKLVGI